MGNRPFKFCPACATQLEGSEDAEERDCPSCGRTWYVNAAPTAGAAIVRDGRVLITRRGTDPEKGKFDVPGGFLEPGEDPVAAVKRELEEELHIEVDVEIEDCVQMVPHEYGDDGDIVLAIGFVARLINGEPRPDDDVDEARWVSMEELDGIEFAWGHDRDLAKKALARAKGAADG